MSHAEQQKVGVMHRHKTINRNCAQGSPDIGLTKKKILYMNVNSNIIQNIKTLGPTTFPLSSKQISKIWHGTAMSVQVIIYLCLYLYLYLYFLRTYAKWQEQDSEATFCVTLFIKMYRMGTSVAIVSRLAYAENWGQNGIGVTADNVRLLFGDMKMFSNLITAMIA